MNEVEEGENSVVEHHGSRSEAVFLCASVCFRVILCASVGPLTECVHRRRSFGRGFSDAAGQRGPLTRIDHRKELDLSGRSLSYTAGLANT